MAVRQRLKAHRDKMKFEDYLAALDREKTNSRVLREKFSKQQGIIQDQVAAIRKQTQEKDRKIQDQESTILAKDQKIATLTQQLHEAQQTISKVENLQTETSTHAQKLLQQEREKLQDSEQTILDLKQQLKQEKLANTTLKQELSQSSNSTKIKETDYRTRIQALETHTTQVNDENGRLSGELNIAKSENAALLKQIEKLRNDLNEQQASARSLERTMNEKLQHLKQESLRMKDHSESFRQESSQLAAQAKNSREAQLLAELELLEAKACFVRLHACLRQWVEFFLWFHSASKLDLQTTATDAILNEERTLADAGRGKIMGEERNWSEMVHNPDRSAVSIVKGRLHSSSTHPLKNGWSMDSLEHELESIFTTPSTVPSLNESLHEIRELDVNQWISDVVKMKQGELGVDTTSIQDSIDDVNRQFSDLLRKLTQAEDPLQTLLPTLTNDSDRETYQSILSIVPNHHSPNPTHHSPASPHAEKAFAKEVLKAEMTMKSYHHAKEIRAARSAEEMKKIAHNLAGLFRQFVAETVAARDSTKQQLIRITSLVGQLMDLNTDATRNTILDGAEINNRVSYQEITGWSDYLANRILTDDVPLLFREWERIKTVLYDDLINKLQAVTSDSGGESWKKVVGTLQGLVDSIHSDSDSWTTLLADLRSEPSSLLPSHITQSRSPLHQSMNLSGSTPLQSPFLTNHTSPASLFSSPSTFSNITPRYPRQVETPDSSPSSHLTPLSQRNTIGAATPNRDSPQFHFTGVTPKDSPPNKKS
ncbi:hypothetical protein BLNAU_4490 [Blattamonas nauphoetae]|uniref:Uncharacterized protein n=1 Tax=Blattamonas nauphoetae TaxID=2049346 RepID=A0ABQ9YA31_9EUKA|nr:hypothetical protein BLNAU_4490 [Blattamonas nauphoetae]